MNTITTADIPVYNTPNPSDESHGGYNQQNQNSQMIQQKSFNGSDVDNDKDTFEINGYISLTRKFFPTLYLIALETIQVDFNIKLGKQYLSSFRSCWFA